MSLVDFSVIDDSSLITPSFEERVKNNLPFLARVAEGEEKYQDSLGWHTVSEWAGEEWLERYISLADKVRRHDGCLVVVGIGGSNQAARAVYEALEEKCDREIIWAGNTISPHSVDKVLKTLDGKKNIFVNVIAKNFQTLEPGISFRVMRDYLRKIYGAGYKDHIIVTFTEDTYSWSLAEENGYITLPFPQNIGGRFSSLSPISLFPLAVAGLDIRALARGGEMMEKALKENFSPSNPALRYVTARNLLYEMGKSVELLCYFEPRFFRFAKWWKQLFGESEGKDGKGLLPMDVCYSEDLHSLGQFVQDGKAVVFETFLSIGKKDYSYCLHDDDVADGFSYLDGKDFWDINKAAENATLAAHSRRFPCLKMEIDSLDEETFGALFYFFQFSCYISCLINGVNPFDQEGVESYKKDMFRLLGKWK